MSIKPETAAAGITLIITGLVSIGFGIALLAGKFKLPA
jgi:hypothetical protein